MPTRKASVLTVRELNFSSTSVVPVLSVPGALFVHLLSDLGVFRECFGLPSCVILRGGTSHYCSIRAPKRKLIRAERHDRYVFLPHGGWHRATFGTGKLRSGRSVVSGSGRPPSRRNACRGELVSFDVSLVPGGCVLCVLRVSRCVLSCVRGGSVRFLRHFDGVVCNGARGRVALGLGTARYSEK